MTKALTFGSLLLLSTAIVPPAVLAQSGPTTSSGGTSPASPPTATPPVPQTDRGAPEVSAPGTDDPGEDAADEPVDISGPGAGDSEEIVVRGRYIPQPIRATPQVISVLSEAEIARTGEGDIAGALARVTGLSVVGGRFVYVRGLGERYSLALLNGSPLPSPEPLRRVVPLDIFPTSIIASTVVQKTYAASYPGEFGGGVINITTKAVPEEAFLTIGVSGSLNSETTAKRGFSYYGSQTDWSGFDNGARDVPRGLAAALDSGRIVASPNFSVAELQGFSASLRNASTNVIQVLNDTPANFGADISAGTSFDVGDDLRLGVIATVGYDNGWQTRSGLQQLSTGIGSINGQPAVIPAVNYRFASTENRLVVNGLLGFGAEFGEHQVRWTNLYIRDTLKEARIQSGTDTINVGTDLLNRNFTSWFERQLIDTQLVGEFEFGDFEVDVRGTYANAQRESPYERENSYRFSEQFGDYFNDLRTNGTASRIAFSDLSDDVWGGSIDVSQKLNFLGDLTLSGGYTYYENTRTSTRRDFRYGSNDALPPAVTQQRPDFLLSDFNIYTYGIYIQETSGSAGIAAYDAELKTHAGYLQATAELAPQLRATVGVRYEDGKQQVTALDLFGNAGGDTVPTRINNDYWLPTATVTWNFAEDMQFRVAASQTIARPQFRELANQQYLDTESDRTFFGNEFLVDSELVNLDARYEWFTARDERITLAGFWKELDKPIEAIAFQQGGTFFTTFANAPKATLYGGEVELVKYFPLDTLFGGDFFMNRRLLFSGNYTYTKSEIKVRDGDTTIPPGTAGTAVPASDFFRDGQPLTGQSEHVANLQFGLEDSESLSQQTLLLTYASNRVTSRGSNGLPDLTEKPGLRLDFVIRQGIELVGQDIELKIEARNLTDERYEEFQRVGDSRIENNTYDLGRTFSIGASVTF